MPGNAAGFRRAHDVSIATAADREGQSCGVERTVRSGVDPTIFTGSEP